MRLGYCSVSAHLRLCSYEMSDAQSQKTDCLYCAMVGQFSLIVTLSTIHFSNDIGQQLVCRGVWYRALEGNGQQQSCHDSMMSVVSPREQWQLLPNE